MSVFARVRVCARISLINAMTFQVGPGKVRGTGRKLRLGNRVRVRIKR